MNRLSAALSALALIAATPALALPPLSMADTAAAFKAAGFRPYGKKFVRCEEEGTGQHPTGDLELADLNGDGRAEAFIREGSTFCFGNTGQAVVVVTKGADGAWRKILDEVGVDGIMKTKHNGWSDIDIGGPGFGPVPVYGFDGKTYVRMGSHKQ